MSDKSDIKGVCFMVRQPNCLINCLNFMIVRVLIFLLSVSGAYALLRGWGGGGTLLLRCGLAVGVLALGVLAFGGGEWWRLRKVCSFRLKCVSRWMWVDSWVLGLLVVLLFGVGVFSFLAFKNPMQQVVTKVHCALVQKGAGGFRETARGEGGGDGAKFEGRTVSGKWLFQQDLVRSLPKRGDHHLSSQPEAFLELESAGDARRLLRSRIYLRMFSFSRFNGEAWSAVAVPPTVVTEPIYFDQLNWEKKTREIRHRVYLGPRARGQNVFAALSGVLETDVPSLTRLSSSLYLLPDVNDSSVGYRYGAVSAPVYFSDVGEDVVAAESDPVHLALPDAVPSLSLKLQKTADLWKSESSLKGQLEALRYDLRKHYEYSLKTENVGDLNSLENFLYKEKRGYCEHFASAAAMFCRALGVPSRIAYGWSGGRFYEAQNMLVFRAKDAHAWTEIKLKGYGWVVFDTTPPESGAVPETQTAAQGEPVPSPETMLADQPELGFQEPSPHELDSISSDVRFLGLGVGVIGVLMLAFLGWRYWGRFALVDTAGVDGLGRAWALPDYVEHFQKACVSLGVPMSRGVTLRQQVTTLKGSGFSGAFLTELEDYHYGVFYGNRQKDLKVEKRLKRSIREWRDRGVADD